VYIVLLFPVLGLTQSGPQVVADRYSYLPCMSWAMLVGAYVARFWSGAAARSHMRRGAVAVVLAGTVGLLVYLTRSQTRIWADSHTLWSVAIDRAPTCGTAHANLAAVLNERGEYVNARRQGLLALEILPGNRTAHICVARASLALNDLVIADEHFRIALGITEAMGKSDTATMVRLAEVQTRWGQTAEAERIHRSVISLEPEVAQWHYNLAGLLVSERRYEESVPHFVKAIRLAPGFVPSYFRLGIVWMELNDPARAIDVWEEGLSHSPDHINLRAELAWVLATCRINSVRDIGRAVRLAQGAVEDSNGQNVRACEALAAALAENGNFERAETILRTLLADERIALPGETRLRLESQRERYRQHIRVRE